MNAVTTRKFCTLQEAAERLNTTEAQIEKLLDRGLLREFRDGPHRLLRTADVGAILAARTRRLERQGQPLAPDASRSGSSRRDVNSGSDPLGVQLPPPEDTASQESHPDLKRPRTSNGTRPRRSAGRKPPGKRRAPAHSSERSRLSDSPRVSRRRPEREVQPPRQSLSIREWFWNGLLQDRPIAIALLSTLTLLALSGLVAGVCWLTGTLR
jgi:excisionase family DNA binding protein